jgi:hypothetical protein
MTVYTAGVVADIVGWVREPEGREEEVLGRV